MRKDKGMTQGFLFLEALLPNLSNNGRSSSSISNKPTFLPASLPGFDSHLNIPVKFFSVHIQGRNEGHTVELRSDASEVSWKIKMESRRLTVGWKQFASAHDFRVGDVIIFRHEGALVFHVTSFGPSSCEIQYVQSCNNDNDLEDDQDNIRNMSMEQSLKTEPESSQDEDNKDKIGKLPRKKHVKKRIAEAEAKSCSLGESCFVAHITHSNLREDTLFFPKKFVRSDGLNKGNNKIILMKEGVRTWTLILKFRNSSRTFYMRGGWRSFCHENGLTPGDSVAFKLESNNTKTPILCFSTVKSKSVSTEDGSKGKSKITGKSSDRVSSSSSSPRENRFVKLNVTPSSLQNGRLYLPQRFTRENKMEKEGGKKISLSDKHGVEWPVNLVMCKKYTRMRLGPGLKEFFNAIDVKEYESVVLELIREETTTLPMLKFYSKSKT